MAIKFLNNINTESNQPIKQLVNQSQKFWNAEDAIGAVNFVVSDSSNPTVAGLVNTFMSRVYADGGYTDSPECIESSLNPIIADPQGSTLDSGAKIASFIKAISDKSSLIPYGALIFGTSTGDENSLDAIESMRLTSDGKLGLGTDSPSTKLDVVGGLKVSEAVTLSNYASGLLEVDANGLISVDTSTYLTSETFGATDVAFSLDGNDIIAGDSISLAGGLSYNPSTDTLTQTDTQYSAGSGLTLNSGSFSVNGDLSSVTYIIGRDSNDKYVVNSTDHSWYLDGTLDMRLDNSGNLDVDGDVIAYSTVTNSDKRLKTDISTIEGASDKVSRLRGVEYTWDYGKHKGKRDIGLIAQEVEEVVPEVVSEGKLLDGTTAKRVDYAKLVGLLIEANKELNVRIKQLEERLDGFTE